VLEKRLEKSQTVGAGVQITVVEKLGGVFGHLLLVAEQLFVFAGCCLLGCMMVDQRQVENMEGELHCS